MTTALVCWWHRNVLGHCQQLVMNGVTEPGVRCYCPGLSPWEVKRLADGAITERFPAFRWFPSDGGRGR